MSTFKHFNNITQLHNFVLKSIENVINFIVCSNSYQLHNHIGFYNVVGYKLRYNIPFT